GADGADLSARVAWASSVDRLLGLGSTLVVTRLSVGVHTISALVTDPGNGKTGSASVRLTVIPADGTLTFPAIADTFVDASQPGVAFGTTTSVRIDTSPVNRAYFRFQLAGLMAPVKQARLRLTAGGSEGAASDSGGAVFRVTDHSWTEATTFATAPPTDGSALATQGAVTPNAVVEFDVTRAVLGDGL